ncbi:MAG TPA: carboxypeptidase-like regulatory domain-containing protein [Acidobacteriaceae bacterium]
MKRLVCSLFLVFAAAFASAQMETIEYAKTFSVRHLAGVAKDPSGAIVSDVRIEVCNDDWASCFAAVTTGADGRFSFLNLPGRSIYFVKVSARGFDQLRLKVRLRSFARGELAIRMHIAT